MFVGVGVPFGIMCASWLVFISSCPADFPMTRDIRLREESDDEEEEDDDRDEDEEDEDENGNDGYSE